MNTVYKFRRTFFTHRTVITMKKIAVYGGSFDPPHKGHKTLAENLAEACGAEKVIIIPAHSSPFKNGCCASDTDRLEMCRLAFCDSFFEVSNTEINRGGKSYTYDTLCELKKLYPDSVIYLFMGDDMFLSLDRWYRHNDLLKLCIPVAACRTEDKRCFDEMKKYAENVLGLQKNEYIISSEKPFEISSSEIRKLIKENDAFSDYVDKKFYDFIISRGLYNEK